MTFSISGQTPSQKNRKIISTNRATGRPFLRTEEKVKVWQLAAGWELKSVPVHFDDRFRVNIDYMFHVKDNRRRDIDNMMASVNDALVTAGIIADDSWQMLRINSADAMLDKENPRAEIKLIRIN